MYFYRSEVRTSQAQALFREIMKSHSIALDTQNPFKKLLILRLMMMMMTMMMMIMMMMVMMMMMVTMIIGLHVQAILVAAMAAPGGAWHGNPRHMMRFATKRII